ncbi:MAG: IS66 family transposase zinc-finger binding domain-containing protein [Alphaproteobacteria bacterium]|nr:IS66 family transposase zinc-finger binding domain-containing protein [Alphaproteobacteria bacterium]
MVASMSSNMPDLPGDIDALKALVRSQAEQIRALKADTMALRALIFGAKSERARVIFDGEQQSLNLQGLGPLVAANDAAPAGGTKAPCQPRKATRNLGRLPSHLPRIEQVIEPTQTTCPCCAGALHRIGQDMSEALEIIPAIVRVLRTIRQKYACRAS